MEQSFVIQKKKLYEEVMEQISLLIKKEDYKEGDRLPSLKELSQMFHVGQPTVREALSVLVASGLIEIRHGSGIFVREFNTDKVVTTALERVDAKKLLYWLEYRRAVEVEVAGLAATRRTESDIVMIEEAQKNLVEETREGKLGAYWEYEFHHRIALATHNPIFAQAITTTEEILQRYFEISENQTFVYPSRAVVVSHEHNEILEAIINKQPEEAKRAMLNHIENVKDRIQTFYMN